MRLSRPFANRTKYIIHWFMNVSQWICGIAIGLMSTFTFLENIENSIKLGHKLLFSQSNNCFEGIWERIRSFHVDQLIARCCRQKRQRPSPSPRPRQSWTSAGTGSGELKTRWTSYFDLFPHENAVMMLDVSAEQLLLCWLGHFKRSPHQMIEHGGCIFLVSSVYVHCYGLFSIRRWTTVLALTVKHEWNNPMHAVHNFGGLT